ncbi:MAG: hypothetical protein ACRDGA_08065 [Bacteroidota bacterium]
MTAGQTSVRIPNVIVEEARCITGGIRTEGQYPAVRRERGMNGNQRPVVFGGRQPCAIDVVGDRRSRYPKTERKEYERTENTHLLHPLIIIGAPASFFIVRDRHAKPLCGFGHDFNASLLGKWGMRHRVAPESPEGFLLRLTPPAAIALGLACNLQVGARLWRHERTFKDLRLQLKASRKIGRN